MKSVKAKDIKKIEELKELYIAAIKAGSSIVSPWSVLEATTPSSTDILF